MPPCLLACCGPTSRAFPHVVVPACVTCVTHRRAEGAEREQEPLRRRLLHLHRRRDSSLPERNPRHYRQGPADAAEQLPPRRRPAGQGAPSLTSPRAICFKNDPPGFSSGFFLPQAAYSLTARHLAALAYWVLTIHVTSQRLFKAAGELCFGIRDTGANGFLIIGDTTMEVRTSNTPPGMGFAQQRHREECNRDSREAANSDFAVFSWTELLRGLRSGAAAHRLGHPDRRMRQCLNDTNRTTSCGQRVVAEHTNRTRNKIKRSMPSTIGPKHTPKYTASATLKWRKRSHVFCCTDIAGLLRHLLESGRKVQLVSTTSARPLPATFAGPPQPAASS